MSKGQSSGGRSVKWGLSGAVFAGTAMELYAMTAPSSWVKLLNTLIFDIQMG